MFHRRGSGGARSYTAELLAPLLDAQPREERDVFDPEEAARKRAGDVDLKKVGKDALLPWTVDGRAWHTVTRVSHRGTPARWEGEALNVVIDALAESDSLGEPNWNHRSVVEVTHRSRTGGWFLHAETGDEWLLSLKFRVKKGTFDEAALIRQLALKPVDELDELPVYGRGERVRSRNLKGPYQEVVVTVHWRREIETPGFRRFLKEAVAAYSGQAQAAALNPEDLTPWKVLGRKWHISRKGFPSNKRVLWAPELVERLADDLERVHAGAVVDWGGQQSVSFRAVSGATQYADLYTKRREGVDVILYAEPNRFALGMISTVGSEREISLFRDGRQAIKLRFTSTEETDNREWRELLRELSTGS